MENEIIAGNVYDKYGSRNPVVRLLMKSFYSSLNELLIPLELNNLLEVGCGEGHLASYMKKLKSTIKTEGIDISSDIIKLASETYPDIKFSVQSLYGLSYPDNSFDMVVASEVLEHLEYPEKAMTELKRVTKKHCLLSVPREPLWRILNILRLKYLNRLGNTPGHMQHWNKKKFLDLIGNQFEIEKICFPTPWIMALCKK